MVLSLFPRIVGPQGLVWIVLVGLDRVVHVLGLDRVLLGLGRVVLVVRVLRRTILHLSASRHLSAERHRCRHCCLRRRGIVLLVGQFVLFVVWHHE